MKYTLVYLKYTSRCLKYIWSMVQVYLKYTLNILQKYTSIQVYSKYTKSILHFSKGEYTRVLNMLGLHSILNMPEYARIIFEYVKICVNVPKFAWLAFVLFPHCNPLSTWRVGYLFQCLHKTRSYSPKNCEAAFLKRQNLIYSIVAGSVSFIFCFKLFEYFLKFSNYII